MPQESENFQNKLIRSFGRIKSRKLSDHKNHLLENLLPTYELKTPIAGDTSMPANLEIGFGFGDFLFENAKNNPQNRFFGFEPHINGVVNLLAKLEKDPLENLQISADDVRPALENFSDGFFSRIHILFPDPWPKTKHFKRRLISKDFLDNVLAPKIKKSGRIIIATDHDAYKTWILNEILSSEKFSWVAKSKKDWQVFPNDWTVTKYQKKAEREGRVSVIFELIRN
jgi:tRNA (guanine-N7-)-methyltransferase